MSEETTFVDYGAGYDDVKEPELAPTAQYHLIIENCKYIDDGKPRFMFNIKIQGGDFATLFHSVYLPTEADDDQKRKNKILFAKRFNYMFKIPVIGGKFNPTDAVGREAVGNVKLVSYTKTSGEDGKKNELVVPNMPQ